VRLFFLEFARRISTVAIGATEYHILLGFMHRLHAPVAFQATDTFCVRLGPRLVNPIARRQCHRSCHRRFDGDRGRRAVAGRSQFLCNEWARDAEEQKQRTFNVQRPASNAQLESAGPHFAFLSAVRMLAEKILISSSVSISRGRTLFMGISSSRAINRIHRLISFSSFKQMPSL